MTHPRVAQLVDALDGPFRAANPLELVGGPRWELTRSPFSAAEAAGLTEELRPADLEPLREILTTLLFEHLVKVEGYDVERLPFRADSDHIVETPLFGWPQPLALTPEWTRAAARFLLTGSDPAGKVLPVAASPAAPWDAVAGEWLLSRFLESRSCLRADGFPSPSESARSTFRAPFEAGPFRPEGGSDPGFVLLVLKRTFAQLVLRLLADARDDEAIGLLLTRLSAALSGWYDDLERSGRFEQMTFFVVLYLELDPGKVRSRLSALSRDLRSRQALEVLLPGLAAPLRRLLSVRHEPLSEAERRAKAYLFEILSDSVRRELSRVSDDLSAGRGGA